mmetsp:Transcript_3111/g.11137  ORF Transcript_3111/g.11137 Transcript_3111/m.11137 type:complete len:208 (-) Transcript_3111:114-737(-)
MSAATTSSPTAAARGNLNASASKSRAQGAPACAVCRRSPRWFGPSVAAAVSSACGGLWRFRPARAPEGASSLVLEVKVDTAPLRVVEDAAPVGRRRRRGGPARHDPARSRRPRGPPRWTGLAVDGPGSEQALRTGGDLARAMSWNVDSPMCFGSSSPQWESTSLSTVASIHPATVRRVAACSSTSGCRTTAPIASALLRSFFAALPL